MLGPSFTLTESMLDDAVRRGGRCSAKAFTSLVLLIGLCFALLLSLVPSSHAVKHHFSRQELLLWSANPAAVHAHLRFVLRLRGGGDGAKSDGSHNQTLEEIREMGAASIKAELEKRQIRTDDVYEIEDLAQRLYEARLQINGAGGINDEKQEDATGDNDGTAEEKLMADIRARCRAMRASELKSELRARRVAIADLVGAEKPDYEDRLAQKLFEDEQLAKEYSAICKPGVVAHDLTESQLDQELANPTTPILLDMFAEWCGPCKMMTPWLEGAAKQLGKLIRVIKVDVDQLRSVSQRLRISAMPTLILFDRNGKEVKRSQGAMQEAQIVDFVKSSGVLK